MIGRIARKESKGEEVDKNGEGGNEKMNQKIENSVNAIKQEINNLTTLNSNSHTRIVALIQGYRWGLDDCEYDYREIIKELEILLENRWKQLLKEELTRA